MMKSFLSAEALAFSRETKSSTKLKRTVQVVKGDCNSPRLRGILLVFGRATACGHASILDIFAPLDFQVSEHGVVAHGSVYPLGGFRNCRVSL